MMPHDLYHHDSFMAVCSAVKPVDGFGGNPYSRIKSESDIRPKYIIIDGLGDAYHIKPLFGQQGGGTLCAVSTYTYECIKPEFIIMFADELWLVDGVEACRFLERVFPRCTEYGSAHGEYPRKLVLVEVRVFLVDQAEEAC